MFAVNWGRPEVVHYLCQAVRVNFVERDKHGRTIMDIAKLDEIKECLRRVSVDNRI